MLGGSAGVPQMSCVPGKYLLYCSSSPSPNNYGAECGNSVDGSGVQNKVGIEVLGTATLKMINLCCPVSSGLILYFNVPFSSSIILREHCQLYDIRNESGTK